MEKSWEQMSADEKQEAKFQELLSLKDAERRDRVFFFWGYVVVVISPKLFVKASNASISPPRNAMAF